jgi:hypothetical protein
MGRRWIGEGGRGTDYETQGGCGGGRKIKVEEGWDSDGGAPCSARAASTDKELVDPQRVAERDERYQDNADERGRRSPRDAREFGSRGARWSNNYAGIRNLFIVENITLIC